MSISFPQHASNFIKGPIRPLEKNAEGGPAEQSGIVRYCVTGC